MIYTIPGLKLSSKLNQRVHWTIRSRQSKRERGAAYMVTKRHELPCLVTITRIGPAALDDDNLAGACKCVRDGVADRLGIDDRSPAVKFRYAQEKRGKGVYGVVIKIEPMPQELRVQCVQPSLLEVV